MKNNSIKKLVGLVVLVIVLGISLFFINIDIDDQKKVEPGTARLILYFGEGNVREFSGSAVFGLTLLEAIYSASVHDHFDFLYFVDKEGSSQVLKIGDDVNYINGFSWRFYVNGTEVDEVDLYKKVIKENDLIDAKYQ
ncbi:MAG TPA: hypothetical protein VJH71_00040 [Candidatus Paceibacterota bacterium]